MPFKHGGKLLEHFSGWVNAFFAALPLSTVAFFFRSGQKRSNNLRTQHTNRRKHQFLISNPETNATIQENLCAVLFIEKSKIGNYQKMV
jgi:hypothetical protein